MSLDKLTKEQSLVVMGFTGFTCCPFGEFQEDVEKRLGHQFFTHEFIGLQDKIKKLYEEDFLAICYRGGE